MNYEIEKIKITKEDAHLLIGRMVSKVRDLGHDNIDKGGIELLFSSEDNRIDAYLKIRFNSDYHRVDGGVKCVSRGVESNVTFYESKTGHEIEVNCPICFEDEIGRIFCI